MLPAHVVLVRGLSLTVPLWLTGLVAAIFGGLSLALERWPRSDEGVRAIAILLGAVVVAALMGLLWVNQLSGFLVAALLLAITPLSAIPGLFSRPFGLAVFLLCTFSMGAATAAMVPNPEVPPGGFLMLLAGACSVVAASQWMHLDARERLRVTRERLALVAPGDDGLWDWNLVTRTVRYSERWSAMLGFRADEVGDSPEEWRGRVHDDDVARVLTALDDHIAGRTDQFEVDHRMRCADGTFRWVLSRGRVARDRRGKAVRIAGWQTDLTERAVSLAAEEKTGLLGLASASAGVGMGVMQVEGGFSWVSAGMRSLTEAWGGPSSWWSAVRADTPVPEQWSSERQVRQVKADLVDPLGHRRVFEVRLSTVGARLGGPVLSGRLVVAREVTPSIQAEEAQVALNDQLRVAVARAVRASDAKSNFLANMSHELRTPLTAILGYAELLIEDAELDGLEGTVPDLQRIHQSGANLLALINDLLDHSKIEAGRMELRPQGFSLSEVLAPVLAEVQPMADRHENIVTVENPWPELRMISDPGRLRQILLNLLSNAAKFTEQGTVSLWVEYAEEPGHGGGDVQFTVGDTGIGMAHADLTRLFEAFYQADSSRARTSPGTGLGLAIARRFAQMMGGGLTATSEVGVGSRFILRLPRYLRSENAGPGVRLVGAGETLDSLIGPAPRPLVPPDLEADPLGELPTQEAPAVAVRFGYMDSDGSAQPGIGSVEDLSDVLDDLGESDDN